MKKNYGSRVRVICVVLFFFTFAALVTATAGDIPSVTWPHEESDLVPDPHLIFGKLPNGFRYIVMKNTYPADRVSMHLDVQAGSLNETDDQKGLAHFLEHILFCGSEHFKPGELVKYFQSIGMDFGPDANARTSFNFTVYDLLLPKGDRKSLEEGLLVLKDYADGALILGSEVDRERKVILSEKRNLDSSSYRTFVSTLKFEFPESRLSDRVPIGTEAVIQKADRNMLKGFYDTWYRPENMILVMVGDVDTAQAVSLIEERFSKMAARAPEKPEPDIGKISHGETRPFYHYEKEAGETSVTIEILKRVQKNPDSLTLQKKMLINTIANQIVQDRLDELMSQPDTPLTSATIRSGFYLPEIEYAEFDVECNPEDWDRSLRLMEKTLRTASIYGFTQPELEKVKKDQISQMDKDARSASTRESQKIARSIIRNLNEGRVFQSPEQERELYGPIIESLTLQAVNEAFKKTWGDPKLILITGNAEIGDSDPGKKIRSVFDESSKAKVSPPATQGKAAFPYLPDPLRAGAVVQRKEIADLGIIQIDFANHIRLNIKKTDFKADEVLLTASFGKGASGEPETKPGLSILCPDVINESGVGKLKKEEVKWALAGKNTELSFEVNDESFSFYGVSVASEIPLLFQLLYTQLNDPVYREDAFRLSMERLTQKYKSLSHTVEGAMELSGERFLSGGDSRFGYPALETFNAYSVADIESWIGDSLRNDLLEVSIAGDMDVKMVETVAAKYLGTLSERRLTDKEKELRRPTYPVGQSLHISVPTKIPKGMVEVTYPSEDFWDIGRTRRFNVLGEVFTEKLRKRIREKLGASYSPYAYNHSYKAYPGYGVFHAVVYVDPKASDLVLSEVKKIASDLSTSGVKEEELKLALDPVLTHIKDVIRTNEYWLRSILNGSQKHPQQLDWARNITQDYSSISAGEVSALAKKYLRNDHAATIIIQPAEE